MAFVTAEIRSAFTAFKPAPKVNLFLAKENNLRFSKHNFVKPQIFFTPKVSFTTNNNNRFLFNNNNFSKRYTTIAHDETKEEEENEENEVGEVVIKKRFEDEEIEDETKKKEETALELKELEEAEKSVKTSTPWTVLPTTAKTNVPKTKIKIKKEKRFYLQTIFDEPADPLYWHPPLIKGTLDEKIVLLIKDYKLDEAKALMKRANQAGRPYEEWMYTLMMFQYARKKLIFEAKGLFVDALKNNRFVPTQQLYHSLLYAYCVNRDIEGAQFLLEQMRANKVEISPKSYELFLTFKNPVFQYVEELIRVMKETDNLQPTGLIWSHMIDAYRRNYDYDKAIQTFHSVPKKDRDLHCIHSIMNVYFDTLEVAKAEYYFRKTLEEDTPYKATNKTWSYYLSFYEKHGDYRATDALVERLRASGYNVTRDVYNSMIRSRFNGDNYHYALQAYEDLLANRKKPNNDTYAAVLDSLIASDQMDKAREMIKIAKDDIGFTYGYRESLITAYQPKIKYTKNPPKVG